MKSRLLIYIYVSASIGLLLAQNGKYNYGTDEIDFQFIL